MKDSYKLIFAQLITPFFRLFFAFIFIPLHDRGEDILIVFIFSELLSAIAVMGRNTLISSGFNHEYINRFADLFVIIIICCSSFYFFSSDYQKSFLFPIVVTTISLWTMNIFSAYFLKMRKYFYYINVVFISYFIAIISLDSGPISATLFFLAYCLFELYMPRAANFSKKRFHCGMGSLISLFSQKVDMQIAILLFGAALSEDIFKLNALFLPLAIIVRVFANTALITGGSIIHVNKKYYVFCVCTAILYSIFIYLFSIIFNINILDSNLSFLIIMSSILLSLLNISHREKIGRAANQGDFTPLLNISSFGVAPFIVLFLIYWTGEEINLDLFLLIAYFFPRLLMYVYGLYFSRASRGVLSD